MPMQHSQWPEASAHFLRPLLCAYYLLMVCLITIVCALRFQNLFPNFWSRLRRTTIARGAVLALLVDSWLIAASSTVIIFGIDPTLSAGMCNATILVCIVFYLLSKLFIYIFLMERIFVVHTSRSTTRSRFSDRWQSNWYRGCTLFMLAFIGVAALAFIHKKNALSSDGFCHVGVSQDGMIPVLILDISFHIYLTTGFLYPLWKSRYLEMPRSRALAKNALLACTICLATSSANMVIIFAAHQHAFVCLGLCLTDVSICAFVFFFVSRARRVRGDGSHSAGAYLSNGNGTGGKEMRLHLSGTRAGSGVGVVSGREPTLAVSDLRSPRVPIVNTLTTTVSSQTELDSGREALHGPGHVLPYPLRDGMNAFHIHLGGGEARKSEELDLDLDDEEDDLPQSRDSEELVEDDLALYELERRQARADLEIGRPAAASLDSLEKVV